MFFEIIVAPFLFFIKWIYTLAFNLTGSHGLSIILLSFCVSLVLLPIFILIERAKKRNDAIKQRMKPVADEIKRCYKGQERYYYLKTLNKQHGFSPLKALIPILSLLLQIPFFIAAYQFLKDYEPLAGVQFLFINDLSAPDGLLGSVHLLPILMTLVNIATAYLYTLKGDKSERIQMYVVAGLFLVLLFNLPSGLVLYWTMNNVFSFFRLFITNPEVFPVVSQKASYHFNSIDRNKLMLNAKKHLPKAIIAFILFSALLILLQLQWAFKYNFHQFPLRVVFSLIASAIISILTLGILSFSRTKISVNQLLLSINTTAFYSLLFLALYFHFASQFYFTGLNSSLLTISLIFSIPLEIISIAGLVRMRKNVKPLLSVTLLITTSLLICLQLYVLLPVGLKNREWLSFLYVGYNSINPWVNFSTFSLIAILIYLPFYSKSHRKAQADPLKSSWLIFLLSAFYILGNLFFWNPLIVYSSYPTHFDFPAISLVQNNLLLFIGFFVGLTLLYVIVPKRYRSIADKILLILVIVSFLYSSIIPLDMGVLNVNHFSNQDNLAKGSWYYLLEAGLLVIVGFGVNWLYQRVKAKHIALSLILLNALIIGNSTIKASKTDTFFSKNTIMQGVDEGNPIINFSKTEKNLVLFISDAAQGWYMHEYLEADPSLKEVFSGFTYYPNTVSMANYTYASVPSMMCGEAYSIANLNKDESRSIFQKVSDASEEFYEQIKAQGYDFTSTTMRYSNFDHNKIDHFLPHWHSQWAQKLNLSDPVEIWYTRLWENALFSCSPLFLKPKIYNRTAWVVKEKANLNLTELNEYNFVRVLPQISATKSENPNFIYIHSLYTHNPWNLINEKGEFVRNVHPFECQKAFTYDFAKWIDWMKENGVYNNTKIILVSDHGPSWWHWWNNDGEITSNAPIVWSNEEKISLERFLHLNPLLMVKDYGNTQPLDMDWQLMSNSDVSAIAFDRNDPTKTDSTSRTVQTFYTTWHQDLRTRTRYEIKHAFEVKDWVYDLNNWTAIEE